MSNFQNASKCVRSRFLKHSNGQFWTLGISWMLFVCWCQNTILFLSEQIISLYSQVRRLGSVACSLFLCGWWGLNSGTRELWALLLNYILVPPLISDISDILENICLTEKGSIFLNEATCQSEPPPTCFPHSLRWEKNVPHKLWSEQTP